MPQGRKKPNKSLQMIILLTCLLYVYCLCFVSSLVVIVAPQVKEKIQLISLFLKHTDVYRVLHCTLCRENSVLDKMAISCSYSIKSNGCKLKQSNKNQKVMYLINAMT